MELTKDSCDVCKEQNKQILRVPYLIRIGNMGIIQICKQCATQILKQFKEK